MLSQKYIYIYTTETLRGCLDYQVLCCFFFFLINFVLKCGQKVTDGPVCIYANVLLVYLHYADPAGARLHTDLSKPR